MRHWMEGASQAQLWHEGFMILLTCHFLPWDFPNSKAIIYSSIIHQMMVAHLLREDSVLGGRTWRRRHCFTKTLRVACSFLWPFLTNLLTKWLYFLTSKRTRVSRILYTSCIIKCTRQCSTYKIDIYSWKIAVWITDRCVKGWWTPYTFSLKYSCLLSLSDYFTEEWTAVQLRQAKSHWPAGYMSFTAHQATQEQGKVGSGHCPLKIRNMDGVCLATIWKSKELNLRQSDSIIQFQRLFFPSLSKIHAHTKQKQTNENPAL